MEDETAAALLACFDAIHRFHRVVTVVVILNTAAICWLIWRVSE